MRRRLRLFRSLFSYVIIGYTVCVAAVIGVYTWLLYGELEHGRKAPFDVQLHAQATSFAQQLRHADGALDITYMSPVELSNACCAVYAPRGKLLLAGLAWRDMLWKKSWLKAATPSGRTIYNHRGERMRYTVHRHEVPPVTEYLGYGGDTQTNMPVYVVSAGLYEPVYEYLWRQKNRLIMTVIVVTLLIGLFAALTARISLRPLRMLVARVGQCRPDSSHTQVEIADLPRELSRVGKAFNQVLRRQQDALEAERGFTAAAAHELRSPVADLASRLQMLRNSSHLPPELEEEFGSLMETATRLKNLSGRLLLLSRLERAAHGEAFSTTECDLNEITEDAIAACTDRATEKGITFTHHTTSCATVDGHEEWLLRAVYNIINNAVKYAPANTEIDVSVERAADETCCAVSVMDEGPGIPPRERAQVTKKFYRGHMKGKKEGTGLGLALVADVARAHHGEVSITEGRGRRGTRVTLVLPVKRV